MNKIINEVMQAINGTENNSTSPGGDISAAVFGEMEGVIIAAAIMSSLLCKYGPRVGKFCAHNCGIFGGPLEEQLIVHQTELEEIANNRL